jgi:hypothetical protein
MFAELLADLDHWRQHELVRSTAGTSTFPCDALTPTAVRQRRHFQRKDDGGISMQVRCVAAQFYEATGLVFEVRLFCKASSPIFNGSPRWSACEAQARPFADLCNDTKDRRDQRSSPCSFKSRINTWIPCSKSQGT